MMSRKPPSETRVGARIRVKPEHEQAAGRLFAEIGFTPIHVQHRPDGDVSFWFGKIEDEQLDILVRAIPQNFYALRAIVTNGR